MITIANKLEEFKSIIKIITEFNIETDITFGPDGVHIRAVDLSSISLIMFKIEPAFFDEYNVTAEKTYTIDVEILNKVLKKMGKKEIKINDTEAGLEITNGKDKFLLKYYVGRKDDRPMPESAITSKWDITTSTFFTVLDGLKSFSEVCKFQGGEELYAITKANLVDGDCPINATKIESDDAFCYYDLGYFDKVKELKNICKKIDFSFGAQVPCEIDYKDEYLTIKWILAARMDDGK